MARSRRFERWMSIGLLVAVSAAGAQTVDKPAELLPAGCHRDRFEQPFCSPPGGGIARDRFGAVVCGAGQCTIDGFGAPMCAVQPGGFATTNKFNTAVCIGGCKPATAAACQRPT